MENYTDQSLYSSNELFDSVNQEDITKMLSSKEAIHILHKKLMEKQSDVKSCEESILKSLTTNIGRFVMVPNDKSIHNSTCRVGVITDVCSINSILVKTFGFSPNNKIITSTVSVSVLTTDKSDKLSLRDLKPITVEKARNLIGGMCFERFTKLSQLITDTDEEEEGDETECYDYEVKPNMKRKTNV